MYLERSVHLWKIVERASLSSNFDMRTEDFMNNHSELNLHQWRIRLGVGKGSSPEGRVWKVWNGIPE